MSFTSKQTLHVSKQAEGQVCQANVSTSRDQASAGVQQGTKKSFGASKPAGHVPQLAHRCTAVQVLQGRHQQSGGWVGDSLTLTCPSRWCSLFCD